MFLELELETALRDARADFQPADITCIHEVVKAHLSSAEGKVVPHLTGVALASGLERQEFGLALKPMQRGLNAYRVWARKAIDREASVYHENMVRANERHGKARLGAEILLDPASPNFRMKLGVLGSTEHVHSEVVQLQRFIAKTNQIEDLTMLLRA